MADLTASDLARALADKRARVAGACLQCGATWDAAIRKKRFCSHTCYQRYRARVAREKSLEKSAQTP